MFSPCRMTCQERSRLLMRGKNPLGHLLDSDEVVAEAADNPGVSTRAFPLGSIGLIQPVSYRRRGWFKLLG